MYIVQVTSELTPLVKVGGLADVVQGLSKELMRSGHQVEIFLPKYDCIDQTALENLQNEASQFEVMRKEGAISNTLYSATVDQLKVFLIEPHDNTHFFKRGSVYGSSDETERFIYFCQATREALRHLKKKPDILHLHDWPTALLAALYQQNPSPFNPKGIILTIHNMHHQGKGSLALLSQAGIKLENKIEETFITGNEINLLKAGIALSDQITTVSPQYRKEIETQEGSCGLVETVMKNKAKIQGILNGIDSNFWDPSTDRYLDFHYLGRKLSPSNHLKNQKLAALDLSQVIEGKEKNKLKLCKTLGLSFSPKKPLVAAIARLVPQKSPELIKHALYRTLEKGGQFILLGSSPIPSVEAEFEALQAECLQSDQARILMETDEGLAHRIYAASDVFLIPSLFEPCGLTQIIAMRYGSIPVARITGGLADTVFDIDTASIPLEKRNGFTFDYPDTQGVDWALIRALDCYQNEPEKWKTLMRQAMNYDFSWSLATLEYLRVYEKALTASPKLS